MAGKGCTEEGGAAGEVREVTRILEPLCDSCVVPCGEHAGALPVGRVCVEGVWE